MRTRNLGLTREKQAGVIVMKLASRRNSLQQERKKEFGHIKLPLHEWSDDR